MKTKLGWYKINDIWHHVGDGNGPANWRPEFHSISTFLLYILIHPVLCLYSINMLHDFYERIAKSTDNLSFSRILLIPHFLNRFHFSLSLSFSCPRWKRFLIAVISSLVSLTHEYCITFSMRHGWIQMMWNV